MQNRPFCGGGFGPGLGRRVAWGGRGALPPASPWPLDGVSGTPPPGYLRKR